MLLCDMEVFPIFEKFYFENEVMQTIFNAFCKTLLVAYGLCY